LLAVDLEKAPGEYELKLTGQTATAKKLVAVCWWREERLVCDGEIASGKEFVEPDPEQVKRAN